MVFYWFGLFSPLEAEYRWHSGCCACSSLKGYWVREFKTFPLNMYHTPCDRKKHNFCSYNCRKPKSVKFRCQLCTRTKAPLTGSFSRFIVDWTSASCVLCWLHSSKPGWELQMRHTVLPLAGGGHVWAGLRRWNGSVGRKTTASWRQYHSWMSLMLWLSLYFIFCFLAVCFSSSPHKNPETMVYREWPLLTVITHCLTSSSTSVRRCFPLCP